MDVSPPGGGAGRCCCYHDNHHYSCTHQCEGVGAPQKCLRRGCQNSTHTCQRTHHPGGEEEEAWIETGSEATLEVVDNLNIQVYDKQN